jgi:hypothetical protein
VLWCFGHCVVMFFHYSYIILCCFHHKTM